MLCRVDVQPLLPSVLTSADTAMLLAASPAVMVAEAAANEKAASSPADSGTQPKPQGLSLPAARHFNLQCVAMKSTQTCSACNEP